MRMADAIHEYRKVEHVLRQLPGKSAKSMLATTLNNIGNNFSKNENGEAAQVMYDEARKISTSIGDDDVMLSVRVSSAL